MNPKVSIILQCGGEDYLSRMEVCLRALDLQDYQGETERILTYVVGLDDPIPEERLKALNVDTLLIRRHVLAAYPTAWAKNVGIRQSTGEVILNLDGDVLLRRDMLRRLVLSAQDGNLAWCKVRALDAPMDDYDLTDDMFRRAMQQSHMTHWPCAFVSAVPREAVFAIRGWDERYIGYGSEDQDYHDRLIRHGLREQVFEAHGPVANVIHQWHERTRLDDEDAMRVRNRLILERSTADDVLVPQDSRWGLRPDAYCEFDTDGMQHQIHMPVIVEPQARPRIFQVGFHRCGTSSLAHFFRANGLRTAHWERGVIAASMELAWQDNEPLLSYVDDYDVYTDMECTMPAIDRFPNLSEEIYGIDLPERLRLIRDNETIYAFKRFKLLDAQYPGSKFILNTRDVDHWVRSRLRFMRGEYRACAHGQDAHRHEAGLVECWKADWERHLFEVRAHFFARPGNLLEFDIERDDPEKLVRFFPDLKLDVAHWTHQNASLEK